MVPAKAGKPVGPNVGLDAFLPGFQMRIRIAAAGQWPERQLVGRSSRRAGLAERRDGFRGRRACRHGGCGERRRTLDQLAAVEGKVRKGQWTCHDFLPCFLLGGHHAHAIRHKAGGFCENNYRASELRMASSEWMFAYSLLATPYSLASDRIPTEDIAPSGRACRTTPSAPAWRARRWFAASSLRRDAPSAAGGSG